MNTWRDSFQDRMAAGKDVAKRDRDNGGSTVRMYRTVNELYHALGRIEGDNFDRWLATVQDRVAEAREQYMVRYMTADDWKEFK